jgi:hypothetical protein
MDRMTKSEPVAAPESSATFNERFPATLFIAILLVFLFFFYVLSAPFAIDARGYTLRIYGPVWRAATERPLSAVLKPYFKMCGIEFGYADEDPTNETDE